MTARLFCACLLFIGLLAACRDDRAATTIDSWYNPPPAKIYPLTGWQVLDFKQLHEVAVAQQAAAEKLLETTAALEITAQQAADLLGQPLPAVPGTKPYLTRAVYLNPGGFSVYSRDEQLLISHASMGHSPVPMKRQTLVLQLAQPPVEVFVTCSMAE
ncbi:MAG: hypothetical protein BroJett011_38390 [Chloroflexota bacterium]|nr:MAG: hypothetical protein BroJett011_38390 [Chloroflexota bacterium]